MDSTLIVQYTMIPYVSQSKVIPRVSEILTKAEFESRESADDFEENFQMMKHFESVSEFILRAGQIFVMID